jgi:hypothetical protein
MAIQYTIREISTSSVTVDYDDGSWAVVPINSLMTKQDIERLIGDFQPVTNGFSSVDEVPFTVGESGETLNRFEKELKAKQEEIQKEQEQINYRYNYAELRKIKYPKLGDQFDALYWARQGDNTKLQQIDQEIGNVKSTFPKDMEPMTQAELLLASIITEEDLNEPN